MQIRRKHLVFANEAPRQVVLEPVLLPAVCQPFSKCAAEDLDGWGGRYTVQP